MRKTFIQLVCVALAMFSLTACAALPITLGDPAAEPAQKLAALTTDDLTVAAAISTANGDIAGANCANALNTWLTSIAPKAEPTDTPKPVGPASAFAELRVHRRKADDIVALIKAGFPDAVHIACAPLVLDAQQTMIKISVLIGAVGAAPALAPGVATGAGVLNAAMPIPLP